VELLALTLALGDLAEDEDAFVDIGRQHEFASPGSSRWGWETAVTIAGAP
jgi:hypothetical protein